ncbi:stage II sporulation protein P [Lysinibacillus sp. 2017]|uniref:stage II sporulation protein P n=1 Tax=unclassified Lysinibacillus TaxID=2636778 RepID=UPI000D527EB6|nr:MULTISPECIES: stage II sporulation protein P [unclassified Lysinibacillus]AWE07349.1 stage II sporulation protein P [Lysinibacillus sp. 2017]TGN36509.1 stage II sporulation protein P [Lysinibacillus sp. S2017]
MLNEKELFQMMKETYPQHPSKDFIASTEKKLRQKARGMKRTSSVKRLSAVTSSILLFAIVLSYMLFFIEDKSITTMFSHAGNGSSATAIDDKNPVVFIYHTHNHESYLPEHNITQFGEPFSPTKNVTLVGKALSEALKENNINSVYSETDIFEMLQEQNLTFNDAYTISREVVQDAVNKYNSIKMVFDIHRDSEKRTTTTIKIDGINYARIGFVVSKTSDNYEKNKAFANRIHEKLEQLYPGLSKGVSEKGVNPRNTYNQDVYDQAALLNIGGVENTLEESYRTTNALAKAIKEIIQELKE